MYTHIINRGGRFQIKSSHLIIIMQIYFTKFKILHCREALEWLAHVYQIRALNRAPFNQKCHSAAPTHFARILPTWSLCPRPMFFPTLPATPLVLHDILLRHYRVTSHPFIRPVAPSYTLPVPLSCDTPTLAPGCNSCSDPPYPRHSTVYCATVFPATPDSAVEPWFSHLQPTVPQLIFSEPHLCPCALVIYLCSPSHTCSKIMRNLDGLLNEWPCPYTYTFPIHYVFPWLVMSFGLGMVWCVCVLLDHPAFKPYTRPFTIFLAELTRSLHDSCIRPVAFPGDPPARPPGFSIHVARVTHYTWSLITLGGCPHIMACPPQPHRL